MANLLHLYDPKEVMYTNVCLCYPISFPFFDRHRDGSFITKCTRIDASLCFIEEILSASRKIVITRDEHALVCHSEFGEKLQSVTIRMPRIINEYLHPRTDTEVQYSRRVQMSVPNKRLSAPFSLQRHNQQIIFSAQHARDYDSGGGGLSRGLSLVASASI